jgi:phage terminase large subunit GpA-like protein
MPDRLLAVALDAIRPPPQLTISEIADKHRVLGAAESRKGKFETSRTPYVREIADACGLEDPCTQVVFMKGSQIGGTCTQINALLAWIIYSACRIVYATPSKDYARNFVTERIKPAVELCTEVRERFGGKLRVTKQVNDFRGGSLKMVGAEVAADLRSSPVERILADEVDNWPDDCEGEGDPLYLLEKRQGTYPQKKLVVVSTPNEHERSRVELRYLQGDRRTYWVPCPECGAENVLEFKHLAIPEDEHGLKDPEQAYMYCAAKGCVWQENDKRAMLAGGRWRPEADLSPDEKAAAWRAVGIDKDPRADTIRPRKGTKSFHLSSLYSPLGWLSWREIAQEWLICQKDRIKLKTFINTVLGQTWKGDAGERISDHALYQRREDWTASTHRTRLPAGILQITCGVDVQGDRLEGEIIGWGLGYESWSLDYFVLPGSPTSSRVWRDLDQQLRRRFETADGRKLVIEACGVDSNYEATHVHAFTSKRWDRRVYSLKGSSTPTAPIWPVGWSKSKAKDVRIKVVGVNKAKDHIYDRLMVQEPGPGYAHFPRDREHWYFEALTVERRFYKYVKGFRATVWEKPEGAANEPLDTRVYAYAVLLGLEKGGRRLPSLAVAKDKEKAQDRPQTVPKRKRIPRRSTRRDHWFKRR